MNGSKSKDYLKIETFNVGGCLTRVKFLARSCLNSEAAETNWLVETHV